MKTSLGAKPLAMPTPVWLVGTYDAAEKPNGMIAAWGAIACSKPAALCVSLREATYSHANITARKAFTVNVCSAAQAAKADYFGMCSGRDVDKFANSGLTPVRGEFVDAPYVEEFPLVVECELVQTVELGLHTHFVGEVRDVKCDEDMLDEKGFPDLARINPLIFGPGARSYHAVGERVGTAFDMGREVGPLK